MRLRKLYSTCLALVLALGGLLFINPQTTFATPQVCVWTGGGADANFTTPANWSSCDHVAGNYPAAGDALIFGSVSTSAKSPVNDVTAGTIFAGITFGTASTGFNVSGNSMVIDGAITNNDTTFPGSNITAPISMGASGNSISGGGINNLAISNLNTVSYNVSLDNMTATVLSGSGTISVSNSTIGTVTGGATLDIGSGVAIITMSGVDAVVTGVLTEAGTMANGTITVSNGGTLKGSATSNVTIVVQQGGTIAPGNSPGCITAATISISGTYQAQLAGATTACTDYDQLVATSAVHILNATLDTELINGFTPTIGQTFKIIDNQGVGTVDGTFSGLPEGATFSTGGYDFRISYVGGTGNDVVLTALGPTPAPAAPAAAPAAPNTGLAALTVNPIATLAVTTVAALMIAIIARRLRPIKS